MGITKATLVASDGEGGSAFSIDSGVGVLVETVTLADLNINTIGTIGEVGVRLDLPGDVILARLLSVGDLAVSLRLTVVRGEEGDGDESRAGLVEDGVQGGHSEGGSDGTRGGGDGERGDGNSSSVNLNASVELLAVPDGIRVSLVDDVHELLDSNKVAKEVTGNIKDRVGNEVAQGITSTNNTSV